MAFGFQKDSELTEFFNYHLIKQKAAGLRHRIVCSHTCKANAEFGGEDATQLGYGEILFPFGALMIGTWIFAVKKDIL